MIMQVSESRVCQLGRPVPLSDSCPQSVIKVQASQLISVTELAEVRLAPILFLRISVRDPSEVETFHP